MSVDFNSGKGEDMQALKVAVLGCGVVGSEVAARIQDRADGLAERIGDLVTPGDIVLVKGSKSSKVSTVVDALRRTRQSTPPGERTE